MAGTDDEIQLWYYSTAEEVLPDAGRFPFLAVGGGGTLAAGGVLVSAVAAVKGYQRSTTRALITDRVDVQARFQGLTNNPTWAPGTSGHVLTLDDGQRYLAVSIGSELAIIDTGTGERLYVIPTEDMPGGFVEPKHYLLVKDGQATWELYVDGRQVFRLPYPIAPLTAGTVGAIGFGWADPTALAAGSAFWDQVEVGINSPLPPQWLVDRVRSTMPPYFQERWSGRHEALLRATIGLAHSTRDRMARVHTEFTADVIPVQQGLFVGDRLPSADGWVEVGTGAFSVVRERVRIGSSTAPTYARFDFTEPETLDAVYYARARFILRQVETTDTRGRMGPFLFIRDGNRQVGVILRHDISNPLAAGWLLSDNDPSSSLGVTGDVVYRVAPDREAFVELYVIGRERVILFINGDLVEDVPYERFTEATADFDVRIGRDGSADLHCELDLTDAYCTLAHGDNTYRALFLRRVAERLLFASGCERNDVLDAWMRHRHGVFAARGTDRVITEIRRVACDDEAQLVVNRFPGDWFVGVTYPGVTPVFINAQGDIPDVTAEYRLDHAPNFTAEQLERLIEWYLLPRSVIEARFRASLVTDLTSATNTVGAVTDFTVESTNGFAVGDDVTLRGVTDDVLLTLTYNADEGLTDLPTPGVNARDFSGTGRIGFLTNAGADANFGNEDNRHGVVIQADASAGDMEGLRSPAFALIIASGFTVAGWFRYDLAHDGVLWLLGETDHGVATGGYTWGHSAAGTLVASTFSAGGTRTATSAAFAPAAGTWVWLGLRWDSATNTLTIWKDGVVFATSSTAAFTALDPPTDSVGFGCAFSGNADRWKGRHRDHSVYSRALTNAEMLALFEDSSGREEIRTDSALELLYLPSGWPAVLATHSEATHGVAADWMILDSFGGDVWADWELVSMGEQNDEVVGIFEIVGLDGDRQNDVTPGGTIVANGASVLVNVLLEVFGIDTVTGDPASYRVVVSGTADVAIPGTWDEIHGIVCTPATQANVRIQDVTTTDTLYLIGTGLRASGCYLFDPAWFAGPARIRAFADAATSDPILLFGIEEALTDTGYELVLNGTTPVTTTMTVPADGWDSLRVIAAGYLAAARTVTVGGVFCDPASPILFDSTIALDVQQARVFVLLQSGEAAVRKLVLTGTTAVEAPNSDGNWHILGVQLLEPAIGTVTVTLDSTPPITIAEFAPGEMTKGVDVRRIEAVGAVAARLSEAQTTPRRLGVFGRDENGEVQVVPLVLDGTDWVYSDDEDGFVEVLGIATGHIPAAEWVRVAGHAWRYANARAVVRGLAGSTGWIAQGPGSLALDGVLEAVTDLDATLDAVDLDGTWSSTEDTSIATLDADTLEITTPAIAGSFSPPTVMRKKEPAT